jgi:hypothetical protein
MDCDERVFNKATSLLYFGTEHYKTIPSVGQSDVNPADERPTLEWLLWAVTVRMLAMGLNVGPSSR